MVLLEISNSSSSHIVTCTNGSPNYGLGAIFDDVYLLNKNIEY